MHSLNLGFALWVAASTIILLVEHYLIFGDIDVDIAIRYKNAWLQFNGWTTSHKIQ